MHFNHIYRIIKLSTSNCSINYSVVIYSVILFYHNISQSGIPLRSYYIVSILSYQQTTVFDPEREQAQDTHRVLCVRRWSNGENIIQIIETEWDVLYQFILYWEISNMGNIAWERKEKFYEAQAAVAAMTIGSWIQNLCFPTLFVTCSSGNKWSLS